MDRVYPTYDAVYHSGNPSQNAANLLNNTAMRNTACAPCSPMPGGGYPGMPAPLPANPSDPTQTAAGDISASNPTQGAMTAPGAPFVAGNLPLENPQLAVINDLNQGMPMSAESLQYLNGFIRTQIGRQVRVEFLIGTNTLTDRTGTLIAVGANYILINETESDDLLACDFYNIKFIKFYY